ncbi:hypothetical protein [Adhaeribacter terreus]|uniref:Uncharacterized protein n=1 Tax=Adhaeribacter terreus TaxID=529703 RepID=A0ABW0EA82_9BACT
MNRMLLLALGLFIFGCDNANHSTNSTGTENTPSESVQEGAGSEISPQLEGIQDSAVRLQVDTISTAPETE